MPDNKFLTSLAAAHFVIGLVAGFLAPIQLHSPLGLGRILIVLLLASVLCQAFILGLWGVTSIASPWKRITGLVVGSVYLEVLFYLGSDGALPGVSTVTVIASTGSLLLLREEGLRVTRLSHTCSPAQPETERLRFSIRGLMLLTAAVALLSTVARFFQGLQFTENRLHALSVFLSLCFVTIGFVALWAILGKGHPLQRGAVLFVLSPILGVFFAIAANAHQAGWFYIILSMLLYSAALLASLLVVRSCGYRFVWQASQLPVVSSDEEHVGGSFPLLDARGKSPQ